MVKPFITLGLGLGLVMDGCMYVCMYVLVMICTSDAMYAAGLYTECFLISRSASGCDDCDGRCIYQVKPA